HVRLVLGDAEATLVYLQLKPKLENNKYVENEFTLPGPPRGTVENVPAPKPIETIEVDEEEEHEDSGGLEHRGR
ncbi:hypothetical protein KI387_023781, partial [Taxus chinensis]